MTADPDDGSPNPDGFEELDDAHEWNDPEPRPSSLDPARLVVGTLVGVAGLLLLLQPVLGTVQVFDASVPAFVLSTGVLSLGLAIGAVVFVRRGERLVGVAHAVGAGGFGLLFAAASADSLVALWLGLAVVLGGVLFLVAEARDLR